MARESLDQFERNHAYYIGYGLDRGRFLLECIFVQVRCILLHHDVPAKTLNLAQLAGFMRKIAAT